MIGRGAIVRARQKAAEDVSSSGQVTFFKPGEDGSRLCVKFSLEKATTSARSSLITLHMNN